MKLSDAIEAGWKRVPRIKDKFQQYQGRDLVGACAIGAACYIADSYHYIEWDEDARAIFPELDAFVTREGEEATLFTHITEMNDHLPVSEQDIIDFVRNAGY
jgi:hypothetical protein